ncbi:hypothetical protein MAR_007982 [Mya arenaria]|uniref:Uncharacterized protein n=1 Tax=Mya arenaria TaxID=6604 RepID=A0ABY7DX01_MYAAR|nr:hypothetical protein MAR_007982 [Mya arenaria]
MVKNQFEDTPFWKRIHQTKIADWFRANVILDVAKNGCVSYIETKLSRLHEHILRAVSDKGIKCYECSTRNIVPCPSVGICSSWNPPNTCSYHNSYVERYRKCPNGICDKFRLEIEKLHTQQAPSWQNTSAENWCKDPWEVAKCFIGPDGYGHIRSSDETDFRGLLNILIYCKPCRTDLSAVESLSGYLLSQIRELEWKVRRPALLEMDESDFKALFINMEKFLQQMVKLRSFDDSTAVDAIGHLQMIQDDCYVPSAMEENLLLMKAFMIINVHLATCGIPLPSQDIDDEFGVQKEPRGLLLSLRTAVEKEQQQLLQDYDEDDGVCDEIQVVTNVQITLNDIVSACLPQELNGHTTCKTNSHPIRSRPDGTERRCNDDSAMTNLLLEPR